MLYKADENWNPVLCENVLEWAYWFDNINNRKVRDTVIDSETLVSTVFLGLGAPSSRLDEFTMDYFFETMVFGSKKLITQLKKFTAEHTSSIFAQILGGTDFQKRYKTVSEAIEGHEHTAKLLKQLIASKN